LIHHLHGRWILLNSGAEGSAFACLNQKYVVKLLHDKTPLPSLPHMEFTTKTGEFFFSDLLAFRGDYTLVWSTKGDYDLHTFADKAYKQIITMPDMCPARLSYYETVLFFLTQITLQLENLSNQNYCHRDVSPENILIHAKHNYAHVFDLGQGAKKNDCGEVPAGAGKPDSIDRYHLHLEKDGKFSVVDKPLTLVPGAAFDIQAVGITAVRVLLFQNPPSQEKRLTQSNWLEELPWPTALPLKLRAMLVQTQDVVPENRPSFRDVYNILCHTLVDMQNENNMSSE